MLHKFHFRGFTAIRKAEHSTLNIYSFGDSLRKCSFIKIVIWAKKAETKMDMIGSERESSKNILNVPEKWMLKNAFDKMKTINCVWACSECVRANLCVATFDRSTLTHARIWTHSIVSHRTRTMQRMAKHFSHRTPAPSISISICISLVFLSLSLGVCVGVFLCHLTAVCILCATVENKPNEIKELWWPFDPIEF